MLRVAFFGAGGPASQSALEALVSVAEVTAVVIPGASSWRKRLRLRKPTSAFREFVTSRQLRTVTFGQEFGECDLLCVAAFPRLIPASVRSRARLGAINVHPSLLPKHRGPDPLFWTYFDDDREAGVSLHWMSDGIDDGDLIAQDRVTLERGTTGLALYLDMARRGGDLIRKNVPRIERGSAARVAQDSTLATREPAPSVRTWRVDYSTWTAERLWHFLRGVQHRDAFTLPDRDGRLHVTGDVTGYELELHDVAPGTVRGNEIFTIDGRVRCSRAPLLRRVRTALRAIPSR